MVGELRKLNESIHKAFDSVKKDMNKLNDENRRQNKKIINLTKENDALKKHLDNIKKSSILREQYDFIERRMDELEEEMFNLEENKIDNKSFKSVIDKLDDKITEKGILRKKLNDLKNFVAEMEYLKLTCMNLGDSIIRLKKENKNKLTKKDIGKEMIQLNKIQNNIIELRNSLGLIELKFDDMENEIIDSVKNKEFIRNKTIIDKKIKELETKLDKKKGKQKLNKVKGFFMDFFEEPKVKGTEKSKISGTSKKFVGGKK